MPLHVTAWTENALNANTAGSPLSTDTITLSGSSTLQTNPTPALAKYVSVMASEDCRFEYSSSTSTASATSTPIKSGERLWLPAGFGMKVAGITATL